jgi:hypothetical protein
VSHTILVWNAGAERLMHYGAREAVERRTRRVRQDGTLVDVSVIGSPIRDADGAVIGASVTRSCAGSPT